MIRKIKISLFALTSFLCSSSILEAQFVNSGTYTYTNPLTNNVGIGIATPGAKLSFSNTNISSTDGITWYSPAPTSYGIFRTAGSWSSPNYQQLQLNFLTGIIINPGTGYGKSYLDVQGGGLRVSSGSVGIGTTSPLAKLHVNNGSVLFDGTAGATPTSGAGTRMMWIPAKRAFRAGAASSTEWDDGNIGNYSFATGYATKASGDYSSALGYSTTASGLQSFASGNSTIVSGNSASALGYNLVAQSYSSFVIGSWNLNPGTYTTGSAVLTDPIFVIGNGTSPSTRANALTVLKNGNVGIGTDLTSNTAGYKLAVNGNIRAKKVVVETSWSDFVFEKKYKLKTLEEVEQYIKQNGHLPEIPSAKEIETTGGDLGELIKLQMQKIEELTLYIIEQNKRIGTLEEK